MANLTRDVTEYRFRVHISSYRSIMTRMQGDGQAGSTPDTARSVSRWRLAIARSLYTTEEAHGKVRDVG